MIAYGLKNRIICKITSQKDINRLMWETWGLSIESKFVIDKNYYIERVVDGNTVYYMHTKEDRLIKICILLTLCEDGKGSNMKCPKCGREIDIDFTAEGSLSVICGNCGTMTVIRSEPIKQTELTTAEMLLWLLKHANFRIEAYELGFYIKGEWGEQWCGFDTFSHSEKEAIKAAYKFTREQG